LWEDPSHNGDVGTHLVLEAAAVVQVLQGLGGGPQGICGGDNLNRQQTLP